MPNPIDLVRLLLSAEERLRGTILTNRVISLLRSNRVALEAKRTSTSMRHAAKFMSTRPSLLPGAKLNGVGLILEPTGRQKTARSSWA
jgi:hypothetical protein